MSVSDTPGIWQSYLNAFRNYFNISGYAPRKEFWSFTLINVLFHLLLIGGIFIFPPLVIISVLYQLFSLIPVASITVRRFNDAGKSIWTLSLLYIIALGIDFVLPDPSAGAIQFLIGLYILYILIRDTREHPQTTEKATVGAKIIFTLTLISPFLLLILQHFQAISPYEHLKPFCTQLSCDGAGNCTEVSCDEQTGSFCADFSSD
ncbi:MAG: DUF805 domain-containing protein [Alphaproteobacteria bacterium]|nr:DUF805 domain-containing protein [Alphaproteobacteria bacterium]